LHVSVLKVIPSERALGNTTNGYEMHAVPKPRIQHPVARTHVAS
jgi:hypothetical protein